MDIILLTPEENIPEEAELINKFFNEGLQKLHIRKKNLQTKDFENYFSIIDSKYHDKIVLHGGGFELYGKLITGGIHLTEKQRANASILSSISHIPVKDVSTSFHSLNEIKNNKIEYGYVFISPVFDSISKITYEAGIDLHGINKIKKRFVEKKLYLPKIIALGGINAPHIPILKTYNFDGAAIFGAVWLSSNPEVAFTAIIKATVNEKLQL